MSPGAEGGAGLYIHAPFCGAICPYCDFAVARGGEADRDDFTAGLIAEVDRVEDDDLAFDTVYFGGGTPSLLGPERLGRILAAVRRRLRVDGASVFLEANPEDVSAANVAAWRDLGFFGVSLGVQSFVPRRLQFLGRRHSATEAAAAVAACLEGGFEWVSVDLIYGLPASVSAEPEDSLADVATLAEQGVHHASAYLLTVEGATPLGRRVRGGELAELEEDGQAAAFMAVHRRFGELGYEAYEVSNFARTAEHRSRHNRKYWRRTPYLGVGPSAHSLRDDRRWWNERGWRDWRRRLADGERPVAGEEVLAPAMQALEDVLLGLRTAEGIALGDFESRYGVDLATPNRGLLDRWLRDGLVAADPGSIRLTLRGWALADGLAAALVIPDLSASGYNRAR